MKKGWVFVLMLLLSPAVMAQQPAHVYQDFGYSPPAWSGGELTHHEQATLNGCIEQAKKSREALKKNASKLAAIYGTQIASYDTLGVYLTGCLADPQAGQGWSVLHKTGGAWKSVTSRFATRSFMKEAPAN